MRGGMLSLPASSACLYYHRMLPLSKFLHHYHHRSTHVDQPRYLALHTSPCGRMSSRNIPSPTLHSTRSSVTLVHLARLDSALDHFTIKIIGAGSNEQWHQKSVSFPRLPMSSMITKVSHNLCYPRFSKQRLLL
jgi:hypothetical protein